MRLEAICTYPIKGCHRIEQHAAEVEPWGLRGDRRWAVVDDDGTVLTQRDTTRMTGIHLAALPGGGLLLRHADHPDLAVPQPRGGEPLTVQVWSATVAAARADDAAAAWLTKVLDLRVRLVWLEDVRQRAVEPEYARPADRVGFADGYPLLLANAASLDALNDWLIEDGSYEGPLPMTRFRPNVVISGAPPWAEDTWLGGRIRIGDLVFRAAKPCGRCVVTTTDQETGVKGHEPLRTLARHRNVNQELLFGVNLIPDGVGTISVGDTIEVL